MKLIQRFWIIPPARKHSFMGVCHNVLDKLIITSLKKFVLSFGILSLFHIKRVKNDCLNGFPILLLEGERFDFRIHSTNSGL